MQKPRNVPDYRADLTQASFSVLLELMTILEPYRDSLVLIGGWVPYLLLRDHSQIPEAEFQHIGSIDIDLIVDPTMVDSNAYSDMIHRLKEKGYEPDTNPKRTFTLNRNLPHYIDPIGIDFLTVYPSSDSGGFSERMIKAGHLSLMLQFAELALKFWKKVAISGIPPGGSKEISLEIKVADLPAFYALKGAAFGDRQEGRDSYDIYYLTRNYGAGVKEVVEKLKPHLHEQGLRRGLEFLKQRFLSRLDPMKSPAINHIVSFSLPTSVEEEQRLRREVAVTMETLLEDLFKETD